MRVLHVITGLRVGGAEVQLLEVARNAIASFLEGGEIPPWRAESPALLQPRATFVTLWRRDGDELRGCRGENGGAEQNRLRLFWQNESKPCRVGVFL